MTSSKLPWLAIVLAVLAIFSSFRPSRQTDLSDARRGNTLFKVLRENRLRVCYITYPPAEFRDPASGTLRGHFVDAVQEIVRQLNPAIKLEYEETTWADFAEELVSGRVDLCITGTFTTIPRAKRIAFTRPLVYLGRSAIVRKDDVRFSASAGPMQFDRSNIKVGVVDGEGSFEFVKANFKHQSNITVFSGSDLSQCLAAVASGQVDVGMSDALETWRFAKVHADVTDLFAGHPYDVTPIAWAVRQEDTVWRDFLNTAIETLETQGRLAVFESAYDYRWSHPVIEFRPR